MLTDSESIVDSSIIKINKEKNIRFFISPSKIQMLNSHSNDNILFYIRSSHYCAQCGGERMAIRRRGEGERMARNWHKGTARRPEFLRNGNYLLSLNNATIFYKRLTTMTYD